MLSRSRLRGAVRAFERRSLQLLGVIGLLLLGFGIAVTPTSTAGAALVSIGTSFISAIVVAAFALEREEFAQALLDLGVLKVFRDRRRDFEDEFWTELVKRCRLHYKVLGAANHGYWHDEQTRRDTEDTFREAIIKRAVQVELLFLKPDGEHCKQRGKEEQRDTAKDTLVSISNFWRFRESLPTECQSRLQLREYDLIPSCGITWADDMLLVTHYLAGRNNLGSPGMLLRSGTSTVDAIRPVSSEERQLPLTDVYMRNFVEIASPAKSKEITPERFTELQQQLSTIASREARGEHLISEADLRDRYLDA